MKKAYQTMLLMASIAFCQVACDKDTINNNANLTVSNGQQEIRKQSLRVGSDAIKDFTSDEELNDPSVKNDFEIRNGILHFKNLQNFVAFEENLRKSDSLSKVVYKYRFRSKNKIAYEVL